MGKHLRRVVVSVVLAALIFTVTAITAAAATPERQTVTFFLTIQDEVLTETCGVEVTRTESARIVFLTFPDREVGPLDLRSIHVDVVVTAGDNSVRLHDGGVDLLEVQPDGAHILMIAGRVVFQTVTGLLKVNLTTGEVITEPQETISIPRICEMLTR